MNMIFQQNQTDLRFEIVEDGARLAEIGPAWTGLWKRVDGLIFQSPAWVRAWWETAPDRNERGLRIGLVWKGDQLEAVMALATHRRRGLVFLEWAARDVSDYCDFLATPESSPETLTRLWSRLYDRGGFDIALIGRLQPEARGWCLRDDRGSHLRLNHRTEISHRVVSSEDGDSWLKSQSKKNRKNFRRHWKILEENGPIVFRLMGADEPRDAVIDRFLTLKRDWLAAQGLPTALFDENAGAITILIDTLADAGLLNLFVLESDGGIAAVAINFVQHGTMMAYLTAYDPAYDRASPGSLLITEYIMWAFDNGLRTVDFLCGGEAFKARFGTDAVALGTLAGAGSMKGRLFLAADDARHRLAQLRDMLAPIAGRVVDQVKKRFGKTPDPENRASDGDLETQR